MNSQNITMTETFDTTADGRVARVSDYIALLKPKVMSLVIFTGIAGMIVAPGHIHPFLAVVAILCLSIGAGAAGAINMWYDRDIDAVMNRTRGRPIPMGRIAPDDALGFGVILSLFSVMVMGLAVNWVAAALLAVANLFYVFVYTMWLKRRTAQNIVIGGAAGAFPPMIGWAAVTGDVTLVPIILFFIIFFWTPPHFWALSLFANQDYKRANVPMMPVVTGERSTKWQMFVYTLALTPIAMAPSLVGFAGEIYLYSAGILNILFILSAIRVLQEETGKYRHAKIMFGYSVFYLFFIFMALVLDAQAHL